MRKGIVVWLVGFVILLLGIILAITINPQVGVWLEGIGVGVGLSSLWST